MSQKALVFNDHETVSAIMKETYPGKQKSLGHKDRIKNFNERICDEKCLEFMERG